MDLFIDYVDDSGTTQPYERELLNLGGTYISMIGLHYWFFPDKDKPKVKTWLAKKYAEHVPGRHCVTMWPNTPGACQACARRFVRKLQYGLALGLCLLVFIALR